MKQIFVLILALITLALFFISTKNTQAQLADSPWPMFHGDVRHTGLSKYDTSWVDGTLKWTFEAGEGIESSPAIGVDGTIYFGAHDNKFYAVSPNGSLKWKFDAGNPVYSEEWDVWKGITSSPAIDENGTIYFVSMSNYLFALNPDGSEKWRYVVHDFVNMWLAPVIGSDGTIYVGSESYPPGGKVQQEIGGNFYAFNPDGTLKWKYESGAAGFGNYAAIGTDDTIYSAGGDFDPEISTYASKVFAFNSDGTVKWKFKPDAVIEGSPTIADDGTIYVGTKNGKFYALNSDGTQKWIFQAGDGISAIAALAKDGTIYIGSWDRYMYALNPDGSQKWKFETPAGFEAVSSSAAIGADGTIYFGCNGGVFYALNSDGSEKWRYEIKSTIPASPAIGSDGTVYIPTYGKKLYAFGKKEDVITEILKEEVVKEELKKEETKAEEQRKPVQSPPITVSKIELTEDNIIPIAILIWSSFSVLLVCLFWSYRNHKWLFKIKK